MFCWKQLQKHCFLGVFLGLLLANVFLTFVKLKLDNEYTLEQERTIFANTVKRAKRSFRFHKNSLDTKGRFYVEKNVNSIARKYCQTCVTLATHCTVESLSRLEILASAWDCPISVAVYANVADYERVVVMFLSCNARLFRNVSLHIIRPLLASDMRRSSWSTQLSALNFATDPIGSCRKLSELLDRKPSEKYPKNLLRNVARDEARTGFVLTTGVDMIPSVDACRAFERLASRRFASYNVFASPAKEAFVVPAFEVQSAYYDEHRLLFPLSKAALQTLIESGAVRSLASETCSSCRNRTEYERWISLPASEGQVSVAYEVSWYHSYEPLFVAEHRIAPAFDERFDHQDFDKLSRACEMHISGWRFRVLDSTFLLRRSDLGKEKKSADDEMNFVENMDRYLEFRKHLARKYPDSTKKCDIPSFYTT